MDMSTLERAPETRSRSLPPDGVSLNMIGFSDLVGRIGSSAPIFDAGTQIRLYRDWLAAGGRCMPDAYAAWFNMGVLYGQCGDRSSAILAYRQALVLKPGFAAASVNLGLALEAGGCAEAALQSWSAAMQPDAERIMLLNQQARLLELLGRLAEAEQMLRRSLRIDPAQPDAIQHWIHLRQKMCLWPVFDETLGICRDALSSACGPLAILAATDDVAQQTDVAAAWISRKTRSCPERLASDRPYRHGRLRIGYLSADFCRHAMSYLIVELFERHDRQRFELFGYCSSREDGSDVRRRVLASFDHVRLIGQLDDEQAARTIRADEIDILIDLSGLTAGGRLQILRWKPAPVQATYLGFVGPVPIPELDALLCDSYVVPPSHAAAYQPAPAPIPGLYQANESDREVMTGLTRAAAGLPLDAFVLCCFCGHFKITEEMFGAWLAILAAAPNTVLWLADDNPWSRASMQDRARMAGVDPGRLLFAERCAPELYMARLRLADLFLDTTPYNAGTVASDAIRMRLPILTLPGRSFASRMAARLLDAYGVTGGIAGSMTDYVSMAVAFATQPHDFDTYRCQFSDERWQSTLGDSSAFTHAFEEALLSLSERQRRLSG